MELTAGLAAARPDAMGTALEVCVALGAAADARRYLDAWRIHGTRRGRHARRDDWSVAPDELAVESERPAAELAESDCSMR